MKFWVIPESSRPHRTTPVYASPSAQSGSRLPASPAAASHGIRQRDYRSARLSPTGESGSKLVSLRSVGYATPTARLIHSHRSQLVALAEVRHASQGT